MNTSDFLPKHGRQPKSPIMFEVVRNLSSEEITSLAMGGRPPLAPPPLQRIREIHKQIARMMANNHPDAEIAMVVGRSVQQIRNYRLDPMMRDQIAYYSSQREDLDLRVETQIRTDLIEIAQIAGHEILDRLEDPKERAKIPTGELRQLHEMALDRTVTPRTAPVVALPTHVTYNIIGPQKVLTNEKVIDADDPQSPTNLPEKI